MKNLLITGGSGFVGLNIIEHFVKAGNYKITVLDDLSTGSYTHLKKLTDLLRVEIEEEFSESSDKIFFSKGNIKNKNDIDPVVKGQDYIIHLAAKTGVLPSIKDPEDDAVTNILGTLNLLQSSVKYGIKKFILASSGAVLGKKYLPFDEKGIPGPLSPYGASKLACEGYCSAFFDSFKLPTVVLRFPSIYGKYSLHKESLIAKFIKNIILGKGLVVNGDGNQTRDFLYAGDIPVLIKNVIEKEINSFEIFQLGTGKETSVNEIVNILRKISEKELSVKYSEPNDGEIIRNYSSIKKFISFFNVTPKTEISDGIEETLKWFEENMNL